VPDAINIRAVKRPVREIDYGNLPVRCGEVMPSGHRQLLQPNCSGVFVPVTHNKERAIVEFTICRFTISLGSAIGMSGN